MNPQNLISQKERLVISKVRKIITPLMSLFYKNNVDKCSNFTLTALGIANVKHYPAFYTLAKIINSIDDFDGNIVECGVYRGGTLLGIAHLLKKRGANVKIYGLDSFEGFPKPAEEDALENGTFHNHASKGFFGDVPYEELTSKIRKLGFANITLLKGFFEDTLPNLKDEKFKLVHLDCDLYQSYKICLEFLYDRVVRGGGGVL